jgi:hypothetical protein
MMNNSGMVEHQKPGNKSSILQSPSISSDTPPTLESSSVPSETVESSSAPSAAAAPDQTLTTLLISAQVTDIMHKVYQEVAFTTLGPHFLAWKFDPTGYHKYAVQDEPGNFELPSLIRPLTVGALAKGLKTGGFGSCATYLLTTVASVKIRTSPVTCHPRVSVRYFSLSPGGSVRCFRTITWGPVRCFRTVTSVAQVKCVALLRVISRDESTRSIGRAVSLSTRRRGPSYLHSRSTLTSPPGLRAYLNARYSISNGCRNAFHS